jgi:hypothetical protein
MGRVAHPSCGTCASIAMRQVGNERLRGTHDRASVAALSGSKRRPSRLTGSPHEPALMTDAAGSVPGWVAPPPASAVVLAVVLIRLAAVGRQNQTLRTSAPATLTMICHQSGVLPAPQLSSHAARARARACRRSGWQRRRSRISRRPGGAGGLLCARSSRRAARWFLCCGCSNVARIPGPSLAWYVLPGSICEVPVAGIERLTPGERDVW